MDLLLLSNSTVHGRGFLEHARDSIAEFMAGARRVVFVPFAGVDHDGYTAKAESFFSSLGMATVGAHLLEPDAVRHAEAIFTGGGNTFRLVQQLRRRGLLGAMRDAVAGGARYMGASAGTNIASPTLRTTNDMPIVDPGGFETLGLLPFQINPHYQDPLAGSTHMGETRETRIREFLEENDVTVLGIREGTWLHVHDGRMALRGGRAGARLFRRGDEPVEYEAPSDLTGLLSHTPAFDRPI